MSASKEWALVLGEVAWRRERCDWCGWPLREDLQGCTAESCSQLALPALSVAGRLMRYIRALEAEMDAAALGRAKLGRHGG